MFDRRIANIRQRFIKENLDGLLISSVSNITYLTGYANFSQDEREAYLIIGGDFQYIITDGRYTEAIKREVPHFTLFERSHQNETEQFFGQLKNQIKLLGIEEDNLTVSEYKLIKKHFKTKHFEVNKLRSIKNSEEIKKIETACRIGDLAFEYILKEIKDEVTEKQIAQQLENFIREKGAQFSFPPIVAFGKNSSVPHYQTGETVLGPESSSGRGGQFVLLDFGVKFENYCSDMTRTVFFGQPSKKQQNMYEVVLEAQKKAVDYVKSSVKAAEVDKIARDHIRSTGYPTIPHSLGHGIGLEVHEHPYLSPKSKEILKEGMIFSIEPGIYIPDFGGVRIEDLYVFEKRGLRQITTSTKNLITI